MEAIRERYLKAGLKKKGTILDEAVRVTGRHRKSLIRALRARLDPYPDKNRPRAREVWSGGGVGIEGRLGGQRPDMRQEAATFPGGVDGSAGTAG